MNNQTPSSSTKRTPQTPSSSNQQSKTQVFILSPDILKKLGIASKIPNLATAKSIENVSNLHGTVPLKGDSHKNKEENIKNTINPNLNTVGTEVVEIKNADETKNCEQKDLPNQQEKKDSIVPKTTNSAAKVSDSQKNVSLRIDNNANKEENVQNVVATNINNEIRKVNDVKKANETKSYDHQSPPQQKEVELNVVSETPNLITTQTTKNISNDSPIDSLKTDNVNKAHKIVTNKEKCIANKIKNARETEIYNDKDRLLKQKEKLSNKTGISNFSTEKSVEKVSNYTSNFSLKPNDNINEKHVTNKTVTNLSEECIKVVKIENATDIKTPSHKENEEKLNISTKIPNLSTNISVENVCTSQLTFSVKTDNINEKQHVDKPTNLNVEDRKLTKMKIVTETNSCNDSGPFQIQKENDGKLNITTEIKNLYTGKSVKNDSNLQPPISLKTDNKEQHVKSKIVTNLNKEVSKVIEIKKVNEIKKCNDIDLSPNQKEKEKKLISVPALSTSKSAVNDFQSNISIIKDNLKNKLINYSNTDKNKKIEIQNTNETIKCVYKDPPIQKEMEENSVKSKLFSMLTAKLKNASNSPETKTDKQTIKLKYQLKPNEDITKKLKQTKLFQYCITKDKKTKSETESHETNVDSNKESNTNITSTTILDHNDVNKNTDCNSVIQENEQIDISKSIENKITLEQSTNLLKNNLNNENIIHDNKHKISHSTIENTDKNIEHENVESKLESSITQSKNEQILSTSLAEKSTPKRTKVVKRKTIEQSSFEDPETITPVRKSGRKRKLSTLHTDYITELKLHDGSSQKVPNRGRKSIDVRITEICDQNTEKNVHDLCENEVSLNKKKKTEQREITKEVINSDKSVNSNEKSIEKTCKMEELKTICSISDNTKEEKQNIDRKSSNKLIIINKNQLIKRNAEFQSNVNKIKSNSIADFNTVAHSNENESNSEYTETLKTQKSPKKQIIILENILIKSPIKGNISNLTATDNLINVPKPSFSKLTIDNSSNKETDRDTILQKNEIAMNVTDFSLTNENLKVKSPLKTYVGRRKGRISSDSTNIKNEIQSPEMNQTPLDINTCVQNKDDVNKLISEADTTNKERNNLIPEKLDLIYENKTDRRTSQVINSSEIDQTNSKEFKTTNKILNATIVTTELETTLDIENINVKQKANIITHEKTAFIIQDDNNLNYEKLNTVNLPDTPNSIVTTKSSIDQNTKEVNQKQDVISDATTPVKSDQFRNMKKPENVQIADAEIVLLDDIKDVNIKNEILSTLGIITPFRTRKTKTKNIDSSTINAEKKVDKYIKTVKQEVLTLSGKIKPPQTFSIETDKKIKDLTTLSTESIVEHTKQEQLNSKNTTASITPIRKRGRPEVLNASERVTPSKTLPIKMGQKVTNLSTISTKNIKDTKRELVNLENVTASKPPIRKRGRKDVLTVSEKITDSSTFSTENIEDTKQEMLNSETVTALITPIRKRGRKDILTVSEKVTSSKTNSTKTEQTAKDLSTISTEIIEDTKQELLSSSENATTLITPIRKRGRQAKNKKFEPDIAQSTTVNSEVECIQTTNDIENEILTHTETTTPIRRRGRKPKNTKVEPQDSLPKTGKKRKIEDIADETLTKSKDVTCGVCNEVVDRSNWNSHCTKHNFLCWKVGETPLDLNDRKLVEYILYKAVKNNKYKLFTCPHCNDKKKSVLGFLAHIDMCQLTDEERISRMATCSVCSKKVLPQSMKSHMRMHEYNVDVNEENKILQTTTVNSDGPRTKRKAATKAANLIQEVASQENVPGNTRKEITSGKKCYKKARDPGSVFITYGVIKKFKTDFNSVSNKCRFKNCTFQCKDFEEMKKHLNVCAAVNSDDYICRFCLHVDSDENSIKKHVKDNHVDKGEEYKYDDSGSESYDDDEDDDDGDECDENGENNAVAKRTIKYSSEFKPIYKAAFLTYDRRVGDPISSYLPAIKWTYEFRDKNYSEYIFENIKCLSSNWTLISSTEHEKYMPSLKKSMSVNTYSIAHTIPNLQNKEHDWKEYSLYESTVENDTATIFCGGPIWALAWVPTPLDLICDQYLAVSLQKDFEATYPVSESVSGHELIHFWNFGALQSKRKVPQTPPILEFSIAHNHGMVWCMEWCPSGFYDTDTNDTSNVNEFKKLGLLALACSDGSVPIYAIGVPHKKENIKNNIYQVKPVYKLILQDSSENLLGKWKYQATQISWSKNSGHNIIAGGFSNGMVCVWDLDHSSPLLKSVNDGIIILKPYLSFQAHYSVVSALVLYPLIDKGQRWLLSGSWDRNFKYWDLNNISAPISSFAKRGFITDGVWLPHWLCSFISFDDIFNFGHNVTTVQSPRDFGFKQCAALASNSVVRSISGNDWASAIAQGSLAGELSTTFPRTMLLSYDVDKHLKCKRMLISYNDIIDKTKDVSERKDIMKSEKKPEKNFGDRDDKLFSQYLANSGNKESYVEQPTTYDAVRKKFGLLFCDLKLDQFNSLPAESLEMVRQSNRLHEVPVELYPFTSLNKTEWNPNKQAYLYVACGYQNGFVRLRCLRFMNTNRMNNYL